MKMQSVLTVAALAAGAMLTAADIQLPKPQISGGAPLLTTLARRSTNRNMDGKALSKQQLSDLLWAANGINRPGRQAYRPDRDEQAGNLPLRGLAGWCLPL